MAPETLRIDEWFVKGPQVEHLNELMEKNWPEYRILGPVKYTFQDNRTLVTMTLKLKEDNG